MNFLPQALLTTKSVLAISAQPAKRSVILRKISLVGEGCEMQDWDFPVFEDSDDNERRIMADYLFISTGHPHQPSSVDFLISSRFGFLYRYILKVA